MNALELKNYQFIDDRTADQLRIYDSGNGADVLTVSDGGGLYVPGRDFRIDEGQSITTGDGSNRLQILSSATRVVGPSGGTVDFTISGSGGIDAQLSDGLFDLSPQPANLRLATGQAIEDGSGGGRMFITPVSTDIRNADSTGGFQAVNDETRINATSSIPLNVYDGTGGFNAVRYEADTSSGVLRTPNAGIRSAGAGTAGSGSGMELLYFSNSNIGQVGGFDRTNGVYIQTRVIGDPVDIRGQGGLVDMSGVAADLRLATGQAIEDGSGVPRVDVLASATLFNDDSGKRVFQADSDTFNAVHAYAGQRFIINDQEGGFNAVTYTTSPSEPGTLELTNAELLAQGATNALTFPIIGSGDSYRMRFQTGATNDNAQIYGTDSGGTTEILARDGAGNFTTLS